MTGVPAAAIRELAHAFGNAANPQLCWTLGITEHHNAVDNVFALINLALLVGGVGRYGAGLQPLRGQNNVQGGGDMGAIPNKLPGFQDVERRRGARAVRGRVGRADPARARPAPDRHVRGDGARRAARRVYVVGENPAQSEADKQRAVGLLQGLDHLVVQDLFLTRTAELADVVLPGCAGWAESEGHGHLERAARAARAQGARPAGRGARRHRDRLRARAAARSRPRQHDAPRTSGTSSARSRRCTRA